MKAESIFLELDEVCEKLACKDVEKEWEETFEIKEETL